MTEAEQADREDQADQQDQAEATVAKTRWGRMLLLSLAACLVVAAVYFAMGNGLEGVSLSTLMAWAGAGESPSPTASTTPSRPSQPPSNAEPPKAEPPQTPPPKERPAGEAATKPAADEPPIEIGIAYGTEKRSWLEWATQEFATTPEGKGIRVKLIPMGSLESAHAILEGDKRIHVWSPASSLYRETFLKEWEAQHGGNPIVKEEPLALTPMVLVMWKARYDAYVAKCPEVSLRTIYFAMRQRTGWGKIAGKPEWGHFKFGHTHPNQSNSGLMTLVVMAYDFHDQRSQLTVGQVMSQRFQDYLAQFERGVSGLSNSTGNMMREMVSRGPSAYDALMVYESVAIDYFKKAEGRWDQLRVIYPQCNLWNENPYCILKTAWTTPAHQAAATTFLKFLLSEPIQAKAIDHGFRPANIQVPIRTPNSPWVQYADAGLKIELPEVCELPSAEVIDNLLQSWVRTAVPR